METGETVGRFVGGETVIEVVTEDALDVRLLHQLHSTFHIVTLHSTAQLQLGLAVYKSNGSATSGSYRQARRVRRDV
jgi:hypothetical protein